MILLRDYQQKALTEVRDHFRAGTRDVLVYLPTGGGKTALTASMFKTAVERGKRCAFAVHRSELVTQTAATFDRIGVRYGIVSPHHGGNVRAQVQIISIPTWVRRIPRLGKFDFVCFDEAHHVASRTWAAIHDSQPDAYTTGLSGSPARLDGRGLRDWFSVMVQGPSTRWLIDNGYLCEIRYFRPTVPAMTPDGKTAIVGDAISLFKKLAPTRQAIYFCDGVEHSRNTAAAFVAAGISAVHLDGDVHYDDRVRSMRQFRERRIQVLTNDSIVGEGVDVPGVDCIGMMRRTESLTNFLQWIGRGLRVAPGKTDCVVLDHVNNRALHGDPARVREWSLDGALETIDGNKIPSKRCPMCYAVNKTSASVCVDCGHKFVSMGRPNNIRQIDGDLEEVEAEAARATASKEQGMAKDLAGLIELGKLRGYKNPSWWAAQIIKGRKRA